MAYPRSKAVLVFLALLPVYLGPYMYAYGRTQSNVFPTVETLDGQAMDDVKTGVDNSVTEIVAQSVTRTVNGQPVTWTEVTYTLPFRVLNRIFKTYINFPALLSVSKLTFQATGVFNGTEILSCHHYVDSLIAPTGFEVLAVGSILKAGNNTVITAFCHGPGSPTFDTAKLSQQNLGVVTISLLWTIDATLKGEKVEGTRQWTGVQSENLLLTFP